MTLEIDYSVFDGKAIHPVSIFDPENISAAAAGRDQEINPGRIETFAWLLEVVAQLSDRLGGRFTLRGGANAQLRLKPEHQRASGDIDGWFQGNVDELTHEFARISERFTNCQGFLQFERQERSFPPKDFAAWSCVVPASHGGQIYDGLPRRRLMVELSLTTEELPGEEVGGEVFGLTLAGEARALTLGALLGDKSLTLGPNTTGITNANDRLARQFYDLDNLVRAPLSTETVADAATMASYLAPIEGSYRGKEIGAEDALEDAFDLAIHWGQIGLPGGAPAAVRREIQAWQGANVPRAQHLRPAAGWTTRALRVALTIEAIRRALADPAAAREYHAIALARVEAATDYAAAAIDALVRKQGRGMNGLRGKNPEHPTLLALCLLDEGKQNQVFGSTAGS